MQLVELLHLAEGAPAEIAVTGIPKVRLCDRLESAAGIKASRKLIAEAFVLYEAVLP